MYQTFQILPGVTLRCVQADRFKQGCLSIQFLRAMNADEAAMNALIPSILLRGTAKHPNLRDITLLLDDLYGASIGEGIRRIGDYQTVGLYFSFMEDRFALSGDRILEPLLDFMQEIFLEPVVEDGGFCKEFVEGEKRNLISAIESQLNDKRAYAATRLMEIMCKADTFGIPRTGTHEQVAAIDAVTLYVHYQKLLRESPVEVFYVGSGDGQLVAEKIRTLFASIDRQPMVLPEHTHFCDGGKEDVTQTMEISQAKLCMGFTSPITVDDRQFYALQLFNLIFGMGMTSKLFMTIREKLSLCYNIGSTYYGAKGIITVSAGIDCDKYDQVRQEVLHQLDECKQGNISEQELDNARQALLSSLKGIYDSPASIESYESVMAIGNTLRPVEEYRRCAQEVTLQQVIDAAKTVELHTTYFLKGVEA